MDRPEDWAPGRDASTLELRNDLIDRTLDLDHEAMVHVTATGVGRQSAGQARQPDPIARRDRSPAGEEPVEPRELTAPERRLQIGELGVEPWSEVRSEERRVGKGVRCWVG